MPLPQNRIANLIYFLGGRKAFFETATSLGKELTHSTIGSWITRNSIPAKHIPTCNAVAAAIGKPIDWVKVFS